MDEQVTVKLANLEGQLLGLVASNQRIEEQLGKVILLDKTVAEMTIRQLHSVDAISHIRERIDQNKEHSDRIGELLTERVNTASAEAARFENRVSGAFYVLAALVTILSGVAAWVLNRLDAATLTNTAQQTRIERLEQDVQTMEKLLNKQRMSLPAMPMRREPLVPVDRRPHRYPMT